MHALAGALARGDRVATGHGDFRMRRDALRAELDARWPRSRARSISRGAAAAPRRPARAIVLVTDGLVADDARRDRRRARSSACRCT